MAMVVGLAGAVAAKKRHRRRGWRLKLMWFTAVTAL